MADELLNLKIPHLINPAKDGIFDIPILQYSLAQTPGPDLACQDAVMESEAFVSSEDSWISTSRRARAG